MDIAIVSDTHFGFKWGEERGRDAFDNAREAFERTRDADVVILPGDIFDRKVPKQEVLGEAIDLFNIYREGDCTVELTQESDVDHDFSGTPVVAIHGTHERRTRGFTNPIELLEKMDYLVHLHTERVVFEKDGEKVAIHGMSGVPERYAPMVLEKYAPEPVEDAYNIFVFHQSVKNLVYTAPDHDVLTMEHLPDGFDLLVDGHIHWADLDHLDSDRPLVLPGSTVTTQMNRVEAEVPKGFLTVDTTSDEVTFHELDAPRTLYHEDIDVSGMSSAEVLNAVRERMEPIAAADHEKTPLVRLVIHGETSAAVTKTEIREAWGDDAILSLTLRLDRDPGGMALDGAVDDGRSIAEIGRDLLREKTGADMAIDDLFDVLAAGDVDAALDQVEAMDVEVPERDADGAADAAESGDAPDGGEGQGSGDGKTLADFS